MFVLPVKGKYFHVMVFNLIYISSHKHTISHSGPALCQILEIIAAYESKSAPIPGLVCTFTWQGYKAASGLAAEYHLQHTNRNSPYLYLARLQSCQ